MDMAKAGKLCIAEVEEIVEPGELNPDDIHCPGIYIDRIVKGELYEKPLEHIRQPGKIDERAGDKKKLRIARRAAEELKPGMYVNLGIGIPNLVTEFLKPEDDIKIHTENGMIGLGHYPEFGKEDPDLISAIKEAVTEIPGCSYFCSSQSFSIIRGRHLDMSILGSFEVSSTGDISNWIIPGKKVKGMGGAMDLLSTGKKIIITMEHCTRSGKSKILSKNKMPFTGKNVATKVITELAVFEFDEKGIILTELFEDSSIEEVKKKTECEFRVSDNLRINKY
jgi:3-oxoacid CoA-transferase